MVDSKSYPDEAEMNFMARILNCTMMSSNIPVNKNNIPEGKMTPAFGAIKITEVPRSATLHASFCSLPVKRKERADISLRL